MMLMLVLMMMVMIVMMGHIHSIIIRIIHRIHLIFIDLGHFRSATFRADFSFPIPFFFFVLSFSPSFPVPRVELRASQDIYIEIDVCVYIYRHIYTHGLVLRRDSEKTVGGEG